jgi:hypothetical protein
VSIFLQLFKHLHKTDEVIESLKPGDPMPDFSSNEFPKPNYGSVALFISLTCRDCIHLLEELFEQQLDNTWNLTMYVVGSQQEINEMLVYFDFRFKIVQINNDEMQFKYRVPATPFIYWLDAKGFILNSKNIHSISEFVDLM